MAKSASRLNITRDSDRRLGLGRGEIEHVRVVQD